MVDLTIGRVISEGLIKQDGEAAMFGLPLQLPTLWLCAAVILFLIKHLIADFFIQTQWMVVGKGKASGWLWPLTAHSAIHAFGTLAICLALAPALSWLAATDFIVHFGLDRFKEVFVRRASVTPSDPMFWRLLGIDQTLHGLTHFIFALCIAAAHSQS
jgi:Protein of unknown function (DUF3307)